MSENKTTQQNKKPIGIDLGTTNSCIAYFENGRAQVIKNRSGERTTPSIVSFDKNGQVKVGQIAKRQLLVNPDNTFYSVKRFMGTEKKFTVMGKQYTPEDISAYILMELKKQASDYLGYEVEEAVITVPAYFSEKQRQATKDAGQIAGLKVLRLINEPTAAALSYKLDSTENDTVLIYDLGGGTFDVSILKIENDVFEVKATSGDKELGGDDFDKVLSDWIVQAIKRESGLDVSKIPEKIQIIRLESERVKKELSFSESVDISIPFLTPSYSFEKQINRSLFEALTKKLISKTQTPVETALKDANLSPSDIKSIILVGGSTRMPCVKKLIKDMFGKDPIISVDPDESVALGASIQSSILKGDNKGLLLMDVTPLSLGIVEQGGTMSVIIPRNTTIPVRKEQIFTNASDNQERADISVFQGERTLAKDNENLGSFSIETTPAKRGELQIHVNFELDMNGILKVSAYDSKKNKPNKITITKNTLSKEEIEKKIKQAEEFKEKDQEEMKRIKLFNILDNIKYTIDELKINPDCTEEDKTKIQSIEESVSIWKTKDDFDINNYDSIEKQLQEFYKEILDIQIKLENLKQQKEKNTDNSQKESNTENKEESNTDNSQ